MERLRVLWRLCDVRLHHFEDEEVIAVDQAVIGELAFQVRVAFANQWGRDTLGRIGSQLEMFEFVDRGAAVTVIEIHGNRIVVRPAATTTA